MRIPALLFFLLYSLYSVAQTTVLSYMPDTSVKVYVNGVAQLIPWCGGFNNPQFSAGDLNNDGLADLAVFEPNIGIKTFINTGTAGIPRYVYSPEYAVNFPPCARYMILADYNGDGIPDLYEGLYYGVSGVTAYKGYYNSRNQLCFNLYKTLYYDNAPPVGFWSNAFNNPGDIPAIVDLDNDGDLDFISYYVGGGTMYYYRNMQRELGLPRDSIVIELESQCWGNVYQGFFRTHELNFTCDNSNLTGLDSSYFRTMDSGGSYRTMHTGNTPCLFDYDMDSDYDYLDGSVSFNQMTFLLNGKKEYRTFQDTMVWQDTMWQSVVTPMVLLDTMSQTDTTHINLPFWTAAFNIDVDEDGKKDLVIAVNGNPGENYFCAWYFKNYTTPHHPDWRFQSDSFMVDQSIDLGTAAYPAFFDYNKDGKPDLFVGSDGYYQSGSPLKSRISYYSNTSLSGNPSLTLQARNFLNLDTFHFSGAALAFGDIDNDGKADMLIGHTDGTISYFKNMAASDSVVPDWQLVQLKLTNDTGGIITACFGARSDAYAAPFIYDIDKDGKPDLLIGDYYGYIEYYRNVSTVSGVVSLQLINKALGHVRADAKKTFGPNNATLFIGRVDTTGIDYLLMGGYSGNIYRFTGFQSGDTTATYTMLDSDYCGIDSTSQAYNHPASLIGNYNGIRSAPVVADIPGNGSYDLLVGEIRGGVNFYKLNNYINAVSNLYNTCNIRVFPNPASDVIHVSWENLTGNTALVTITNIQGQTVYTAALTSDNRMTIELSTLPDGMYIINLQSGEEEYHSKFILLKP